MLETRTCCTVTDSIPFLWEDTDMSTPPGISIVFFMQTRMITSIRTKLNRSNPQTNEGIVFSTLFRNMNKNSVQVYTKVTKLKDAK